MKDLLSICKHRSFLCFDEYSIFAIYNYGGKKKTDCEIHRLKDHF